jgi:hypothetical protein
MVYVRGMDDATSSPRRGEGRIFIEASPRSEKAGLKSHPTRGYPCPAVAALGRR